MNQLHQEAVIGAVRILFVALAACFSSATLFVSEAQAEPGCGESCIEVICDYYDMPFSREQVQKALDPGEFKETSLLQIQECLEEIGFSCEAVSGTFDEVVVGSDAPMVAFVRWKPEEHIGHFVIVRYDKGDLTIVDPLQSMKPIRGDRDAFIRYWSGLVLVVKPQDDFLTSRWCLVAVFTVALIAFALEYRSRFRGSPHVRSSVRFLCLLVCLGFAVLRAGHARADDTTPRVVAGSNSVDLGTIGQMPEGGGVSVVFRWTNRTGETVQVRGTRVDCPSCTTIAYNDSPIPADETADFLVRANMRGRYGALTSTAVVLFENDAIPPELFSVRYFRPEPPSITPRIVDFGVIPEAGAVRRFVLTTTLRADDAGLELLESVRSSSPAVSCRMLDAPSVLTQHSDEKKLSSTPILRFEARAVAAPPGKLHGHLTVPVLYEGTRVETRVPFRGSYAHPLAAKPSQIIVFSTSAEKERTISATIFRQGGEHKPTDISVLCDHPRVRVSFLPSAAKGSVDDTTLGQLNIAVRLGGAEDFESQVVVSARSSSQPIQISMPLKVRIVQAGPDKEMHR